MHFYPQCKRIFVGGLPSSVTDVEMRYPVPDTLHPEPYPEPYTLNPTPYTLHPQPHALPTSSSLYLSLFSSFLVSCPSPRPCPQPTQCSARCSHLRWSYLPRRVLCAAQ
eukprot:866918-Rhodomonas_salina.2